MAKPMTLEVSKPAMVELEELIARLRHVPELQDVPFDKLPVDAFALSEFLQPIRSDFMPDEITKLRQLNGLANLSKHSLADMQTSEGLMLLINQRIDDLFKDQFGVAQAKVTIRSHSEIMPIEGSRFKRYLGMVYWEATSKVPSAEAIENVTKLVQAKAEYNAIIHQLWLRVAKHDDSFLYDLTDEEWRAVVVNSEGWHVETKPPPIFTRYKQSPQIEPTKDYPKNVLENFISLLNVSDSQSQLLLKVYIISLFVPEIAHPMLNLYGDKGSSKSMLFLLLKQLVDPSKPTLLTLQKDRNEFIQQVAHNWVSFYDNAKHVPDWLSDEACRAVTGGGHTKRKLYTDDEDVVYEYKHCLGFNGINMALTEEDALDRSILLELARIPPDKRRQESDILAAFEELKPKVLGFVLDTISMAMKIYPSVNLQDLPRMADFAQWGEAISRALGYQDFEFIRAYYDNIGKQNIEAAESHPLGQAIVKFVLELEAEGKSNWQGSPASLMDHLGQIAGVERIDMNHRKWPKAPQSLSRRLNEIKSNLLEGYGIKVSIDRTTEGNTAVVKIERVIFSGAIGHIGGIVPTLATSNSLNVNVKCLTEQPLTLGKISPIPPESPPTDKENQK